jgi:hypothetical protein
MIYTYEDKHPIVSALKKKGWVLFDVYGNRVTEKNGINGGWWIDCATAHETEHYDTHKAIHGKYLGNTLRDSLRELKSDKFPSNIPQLKQ